MRYPEAGYANRRTNAAGTLRKLCPNWLFVAHCLLLVSTTRDSTCAPFEQLERIFVHRLYCKISIAHPTIDQWAITLLAAKSTMRKYDKRKRSVLRFCRNRHCDKNFQIFFTVRIVQGKRNFLRHSHTVTSRHVLFLNSRYTLSSFRFPISAT